MTKKRVINREFGHVFVGEEKWWLKVFGVRNF